MGFNVKREDDEVDELVEMIDRLMEEGDGRLTIDVDDSEDGLHVKTYRTSDCGADGKPGACCQPNEDVPDEDD